MTRRRRVFLFRIVIKPLIGENEEGLEVKKQENILYHEEI